MTYTKASSHALATFAFCVAIAAPFSAHAQDAGSAELSPARRLFVEGRKLLQAGNYAEACPKLEESLRLEVGVGTQFNLADCWERIGRIASARALFLGAAASAKAAGQVDREQVLRERAAALEPRLSRVVVEVASTEPRLVVKRGDLPLESEEWGKAIPMDPGKYTFSARAPGKKAWEKVVEVQAGVPVVTVQVPELEPEVKADPPPVKPAPRAPEKKPVAAPVSPAATDRGLDIDYRVVSVAGLGLAALTVGIVNGVQYKQRNDDAKAICPSSQNCSIKQIQDHDRLVDEAKTKRTWAYVGFGVGTAGLAGAAALWLFDRRKPATSAALEAAPIATADGTFGAALSGSF